LNIINKIIKYFIALILLVFIQMILSHFFLFSPDMILIFLVFNSLKIDRSEAIIIGFLFGLSQDFISQYELLGINSLTKTFLTFFIGSIKLYYNVWSSFLRKVVVQLSILLYYFMFFFITDNGSIVLNQFLFSIFSYSIFSMIIILLYNKFAANNRLI